MHVQTGIRDVVDRRTFIGGSDVAAVLGISPWKTPLQLYLEKIGEASSDVPDEMRVRVFRRGKRMEPYVLDILSEESGLVIAHRNRYFTDAEFPFLKCEVDAEAESGENIEIKTVSPFKAKEWGEQQSDEIPVHYTAQIQHGLMITGKQVCVLGALIGGDDFRTYRVERDDEIIGAMRNREVEFWRRVVNREPPNMMTASDAALLFPLDDGGTIEADAQTLSDFADLKTMHEQINSLEKRYAELKERVVMFMEGSAALSCSGRALATYKTQSASRFDQTAFKSAHPELFEQFKKTTETRVFRIK